MIDVMPRENAHCQIIRRHVMHSLFHSCRLCFTCILQEHRISMNMLHVMDRFTFLFSLLCVSIQLFLSGQIDYFSIIFFTVKKSLDSCYIFNDELQILHIYGDFLRIPYNSVVLYNGISYQLTWYHFSHHSRRQHVQH